MNWGKGRRSILNCQRQEVRPAQAARVNLSAAGVEKMVQLRCADVLEIAAPAKEGIIVTNPPYGVRFGEKQQLASLYPKLGAALKQRFSGWRAYLLSADMRLPKLIRLAASRRIPLFNGALECRLFEYKMVEGKMRKPSGVSSEE